MDKCEICGSTENLITVYTKTSYEFQGRVLSSILCENCHKKYKTPYLRFLYSNQTLAQNLVREYNERKPFWFNQAIDKSCKC